MKKTNKTWYFLILMSLLIVAPKSSFAGDREWATAGKILTGIAAANVVGQVFYNSSYPARNKYDYRRRPFHRKRKFIRRQNRKYNNCKISSRPYRRNRPIEFSRRGYSSSVECDDPIIVCVEEGRRIYQPRVKGATAYLQVYSKACNEWVTLEEYPSIW